MWQLGLLAFYQWAEFLLNTFLYSCKCSYLGCWLRQSPTLSSFYTHCEEAKSLLDMTFTQFALSITDGDCDLQRH